MEDARGRKSTGPSPIGNGTLWNGKHRSDSVGVADIEEHAFRNFAGHFARLEIHDEQSLAAFNFAGIRPLLSDARENGSRMIAEVHRELHQFVRTRNLLHALDGADS